MAGEVMRLNSPASPPTATPDPLRQSSDGWAWGGVATMFSTRQGVNKATHFDNPGSEHEGGAQFLMADGAVRLVGENVDLLTFQNLGNIANGIPVSEF